MTHDFKAVLKEFNYMDAHDMRFEHLDNGSKKAIRHALKLAVESQWKTIETAPKDGSYILLYRPVKDHRQRSEVKEGKFHRYGMKDTWRVMSGGIWDIDAPTHWMPLPRPPKTEGQNQ